MFYYYIFTLWKKKRPRKGTGVLTEDMEEVDKDVITDMIIIPLSLSLFLPPSHPPPPTLFLPLSPSSLCLSFIASVRESSCWWDGCGVPVMYHKLAACLYLFCRLSVAASVIPVHCPRIALPFVTPGPLLLFCPPFFPWQVGVLKDAHIYSFFHSLIHLPLHLSIHPSKDTHLLPPTPTHTGNG